MGLAQDVHAAVIRYEDGVQAAALAIDDLASTVEALADQLSPHGPLGPSADPDLARARALLADARARLLAAVEAAADSRTQARQYAHRVFPM